VAVPSQAPDLPGTSSDGAPVGALRQELQDLRERLAGAERRERQYRMLIETAQDFIFVIDSEGVVQYVNDFACQRFGKVRDELVGQHVGVLLGKTSLDRPESGPPTRSGKAAERQIGDLQRAIDGGRPVVVEAANTIGGRLYWLNTRLTPVRESDGRVRAVLGISRDITDQVLDREALKDAEERHRVLLDATMEGLMIHDAGVIIDLNQTMARLIGRSREEVIGRLLSDFVPLEDIPLVQTPEGAAVDGRYELRTTGKDGRPLVLEVTSHPFVFRGRQVRLTAALDVTDVRLAQEEVTRAQKFDSLGALAGGIAHDFNNILTAAIGNLSLAGMMVPDDSPVALHVRQAEKALTRASELTGDLLIFAKGGAGARSVAVAPQVVRDSMSFALRGTDIHLELEAPANLWPVRIDPMRLGRVLHYLAVNAVEAMPQGGRLRVACANVAVREAAPGLEPGSYVAIKVQDQGSGLAPERLSRIFEPYYTTMSPGHGLGLASSYAIVHANHGLLSVQSQVGAGTTFEILLPAADGNTGSDSRRPAAGIARSTGRVLVMDHEAFGRDIAARLLAPLGYEVAQAADGASALKAHAEAFEQGRPFDVLILDLDVPDGLDGNDIVETLLAREPAARLVASSCTRDSETLARCLRAGFRDVLAKPFRLEALSAAIQRALADVRGGEA
jgi:PAS domain S-box-containing protein